MRLLAIGVSMFMGISCSADTGPMDPVLRQEVVVDGVRYSAQASVESAEPFRVLATISATNVSRTSRLIEYGHCAARLLAYKDTARSGSPVWDQRRVVANPDTGNAFVCLLYLRRVQLAPNQTFEPDEFKTVAEGRDILGDSLPEGRYYLTVLLEVNWDTLKIAAGDVLVTRR